MSSSKKTRWILVTCVCFLALLIILGFSFCTRVQLNHPLSYVKFSDIERAELTVSRPNPVTVDINSNECIKKLVKLLHQVVIYDENKKWGQYNGGITGYTLTFQDGTVLNIMVTSSIIVINGQGYNSNSFTCNSLVNLVDQILSH